VVRHERGGGEEGRRDRGRVIGQEREEEGREIERYRKRVARIMIRVGGEENGERSTDNGEVMGGILHICGLVCGSVERTG
jgi:hypothetical protein